MCPKIGQRKFADLDGLDFFRLLFQISQQAIRWFYLSSSIAGVSAFG
jgi:hypothetical protein